MGLKEAAGKALARRTEIAYEAAVLQYSGRHMRFFRRSGIPVFFSTDPLKLVSAHDTISFGSHTFRVLFTPGHAPGHVSFYDAEAGVIFDGDVLFAGGIGRTDLPGGSYEVLLDSINEKLMILPDDTVVCSGHGPTTTIGQERVSNPFL